MAKVLYVEDEPDIRNDVLEELRDGGHEVAAAENGLKGLELALEFGPEMILSDCLMPEMTGPEMVQALRAGHEEFNAVPVIFLSAHADQAHERLGLAAGAEVYLTKPIDFDLLLETIEALSSGVAKDVAEDRAPCESAFSAAEEAAEAGDSDG